MHEIYSILHFINLVNFLLVMEEIYLSIGSNLGNRNLNIASALEMIGNHIGAVTGLSSLFETTPWGFESEERFLNMVVSVDTDLEPKMVLEKIHDIEASLGRVRAAGQYISRTIDIDILLRSFLSNLRVID